MSDTLDRAELDQLFTFLARIQKEPPLREQLNQVQTAQEVSDMNSQAIRKVKDLSWSPMFFMTNVSISVGTVMNPAGPENGVGILSTNYLKDPTDPSWANDPGMTEWRNFMNKEMPGADQTDASYVFAYGVSKTVLQMLKQCNGNFTRENIMKQAASIKDFENPTLLPGIKVNTSATNFHPITSMQMMRWDGKTWVRFGDVISGA